jgi:glyoxylase I family protein
MVNDPVIHFALATTDTRAALEHVRQAGYEVTVEPKDVTLDSLEVTIAFFKGPNGEIIEFFQTN